MALSAGYHQNRCVLFIVLQALSQAGSRSTPSCAFLTTAPHNCCVNVGAIMTAAVLVGPQLG